MHKVIEDPDYVQRQHSMRLQHMYERIIRPKSATDRRKDFNDPLSYPTYVLRTKSQLSKLKTTTQFGQTSDPFFDYRSLAAHPSQSQKQRALSFSEDFLTTEDKDELLCSSFETTQSKSRIPLVYSYDCSSNSEGVATESPITHQNKHTKVAYSRFKAFLLRQIIKHSVVGVSALLDLYTDCLCAFENYLSFPHMKKVIIDTNSEFTQSTNVAFPTEEQISSLSLRKNKKSELTGKDLKSEDELLDQISTKITSSILWFRYLAKGDLNDAKEMITEVLAHADQQHNEMRKLEEKTKQKEKQILKTSPTKLHPQKNTKEKNQPQPAIPQLRAGRKNPYTLSRPWRSKRAYKPKPSIETDDMKAEQKEPSSSVSFSSEEPNDSNESEDSNNLNESEDSFEDSFEEYDEKVL